MERHRHVAWKWNSDSWLVAGGPVWIHRAGSNQRAGFIAEPLLWQYQQQTCEEAGGIMTFLSRWESRSIVKVRSAGCHREPGFLFGVNRQHALLWGTTVQSWAIRWCRRLCHVLIYNLHCVSYVLLLQKQLHFSLKSYFISTLEQPLVVCARALMLEHWEHKVFPHMVIQTVVLSHCLTFGMFINRLRSPNIQGQFPFCENVPGSALNLAFSWCLWLGLWMSF